MCDDLGWRMKVLNRLDEKHGMLQTPIPTELFRKMYEIAETYKRHSEPVPVERSAEPDGACGHTKLLSASCSFLQKCEISQIPYHFQIVVPGVSGTASAGRLQLYEIAVWERCLLQVFCQVGVSVACFEFGGFAQPLLIDIFPVPQLHTSELYWKSAFEEMSDNIHSQIVSVYGRSMKGVFPPGSSYCVVTFDDGKGMGKIWETGRNPREIAVDVVSGLWKDSQSKPPFDLESDILAFRGWPS
jgi:hypothetical protein